MRIASSVPMPNEVPIEQEIVAYVGLDWADQQPVICWQAAGSARVQSAVVQQRPDELQAWVAELRQRFPQGLVAIALEQSRGAVIAALMHFDFLRLYPINPKSLARYREAFASSGAKDDPDDAGLLLELLVKHRDRLTPWVPDDALSRELALRVEHRRQLVNLQTKLIQQLRSHLKVYFPQALDWVGELDSLQACDFLQRWPTLAAVQKARPSQLEKFYHQHHCRRPQLIQQRLEQIRQAQPLDPGPRQVQRRWARPKFLHQSFVEFTGLSIPHCCWARALYQQLRARGHRHWAAIRVVAYKWIRILFRCWQDRVPYDEQKYLKSLERRNPTLWAAIQQLPAHPSRKEV